MNRPTFLDNVTRTFGKVGLGLKKHSPEILAVAGVAGVVASTVMACKATTKAHVITEELAANVEMIHQAAEVADAETYTEEDMKKDTVIVYTQAAMKYIKLYGPSVLLGVVSLGALLSSNHILRKRNIALAAAFASVDKSFKEYRGRVVNRFGEALDKELRFNIKAKEVEETVVNEDGTEETVTRTVNVVDPNELSDFARIFDEYNELWTKDPEYNLMLLKSQQALANEKLKRRGYLFLNEVYEMIGFKKTVAGQIAGWTYDEKNPTGDNFVDFGIYNLNNPSASLFVSGDERSIILDFNVEGNILETFQRFE